jgi:hypothetical protein
MKVSTTAIQILPLHLAPQAAKQLPIRAHCPMENLAVVPLLSL